VWRATRGTDLVVTELASGALENYSMAMWHRGHLATWGHGYATTSRANWLDTALERWLMRRSSMFFSYTERGRRTALNNGLPDSRMVVLMNTIDTKGLRTAVEQSAEEKQRDVPAAWGVAEGERVCAFVGALDRSKRLDFLFAACDLIWREEPTFRLLVAGDGPERDSVLRKVKQGTYVRYVGRVGDVEKAEIARSCRLLLNPGRVGLVAVDSFVMGTPLATTDWPLHAPEFDYLVNGENSVVTDDSPDAYARAVIDLLRDDRRVARLADGCRASAKDLTMEALVGRFADGIVRALGGPPS